MRQYSNTRELAARMGMTAQSLVSHIDRGTVTEPLGYVEDARGRRDVFWEPTAIPTLHLCGATALVPTSDDMAMQEIRDGFYAAPCRSSGHIGRYDGMRALGLCRRGRATIYPVRHCVRIDYLDPVRATDSIWEDIPVAEGDRIIDNAALSEEYRKILRSVCQSRAKLHGSSAELMVDPREIAVYVLDVEHLIATDVEITSIVRGASWTIDHIDENTRSINTCTLDAVAQWARGE
ncbi:hypothetical protein ACT3SZ_15110 [Corynebacterium sp. AOP40-9SA-29]|uniref:hypothetical protein n=1 Tax=Corynebacterium sp. AOP40-9SA-29 TaxID=3457677 RepID=UPI004034DB5F